MVPEELKKLKNSGTYTWNITTRARGRTSTTCSARPVVKDVLAQRTGACIALLLTSSKVELHNSAPESTREDQNKNDPRVGYK